MAEMDMGDDVVEVLEGPMPDEAVTPGKSDAQTRAMRTLVQGAVFAVVMATAQAVAALSGSEVNWKLLGLTALQAAATALVSYVQNHLGK